MKRDGMSSHHNEAQSISPDALVAWIADRGYIWQMDLLTSGELSRVASDHGVDFSEIQIENFWRLGLLRADLIISSRRLRLKNLNYLRRNERGGHLYSDDRQLRPHRKGWGDCDIRLEPLPNFMQLYFHPFRYYILLQLQKLLRLSIHPAQMLVQKQYISMLEQSISRFNKYTSSPAFLLDITRWHDISTMAVLAEPITYVQIFGRSRRPVYIDEETMHQHQSEYLGEIREQYKKLGLEKIEEVRQVLCVEAYLLDPNQDVHTLLCLTEGEQRLKFKGRLGGALYLRTMAEMIRRVAEDTYDTKLPEEDEIGVTGWPPHAHQAFKLKRYGAERMLGYSRRATNEFIRQFGLDQGVRLRWYVEGETEYGALETVFGSAGLTGIELINLRGNFIEKRALVFKDNLDSDAKAGIFSFISLDSDRSDNLRVVRQAAKDDIFTGQFFVSTPDFEFSNFTLEELEGILWDIAKKEDTVSAARDSLHTAIVGVHNCDALLKAAARAVPQLIAITKGKAWGERLMNYALQHPNKPNGTPRPIIYAIRSASRADSANFHHQCTEYKVDPQTGRLVKRETAVLNIGDDDARSR